MNTPQVPVELPTDIRRAIESVLDYLWEDEAAHYSGLSPDCDLRGHIFESLRVLAAWTGYPSRTNGLG